LFRNGSRQPKSTPRVHRYRNAGVAFLGYRPQDKAEDYAADILQTPDTEDAISRQFHGGPYTQMGFDGDLARIE
jgi:uronate dehydrogenase